MIVALSRNNMRKDYSNVSHQSFIEGSDHKQFDSVVSTIMGLYEYVFLTWNVCNKTVMMEKC